MQIRHATANDAPAIAAIYKPYVLESTHTFEYEPPTAEEMQKRISNMVSNGYPFLVGEIDGVICGYSYATSFRPRPAYQHTAEIAIYLSRGKQGTDKNR